jgi:hypothetical protein
VATGAVSEKRFPEKLSELTRPSPSLDWQRRHPCRHVTLVNWKLAGKDVGAPSMAISGHDA